MEVIEKALRKQFFVCMFFSVGAVAGIPAIVFGAILRWWAMLAVGAAFVLVGFYGLPFFWVAYGSKAGLKRVVFAVVREHLLSVQAISRQLNKNEAEIRTKLDKCFEKGYIVGYIREGDFLRLNTNLPPSEEEVNAECAYCGAKYSHKLTELPKCPYCGGGNVEKNT